MGANTVSEFDGKFNLNNDDENLTEEIKENETDEVINEMKDDAQSVEAEIVYENTKNSNDYTKTQNTNNSESGSFYYNQQQQQQPPYSSYQYNQQYNPQNNYNGYSQNGGEMAKKKKNTIFVLYWVIGIILVLAAVIFGVNAYKTKNSDYSSSNDTSSSQVSQKESAGSVVVDAKPEADALTTTEIAEIAKKSSVGVVVYSTQTNGMNFGNFSQGSGSSSQQTGEGTGVIVKMSEQDKYTYIVTCAHVINYANISVKVLFEDGKMYDAEIVGYDVQTDVGLLRVKDASLQKYAATIGTSKNLQVGQSIFAIGNPGGSEFFGSFTSGVVSAIGRSLNSSSGYTMECIQHDAAINPGNSGGGLLNAQGHLIGINSSKISSTEYEGMSFAVPIDEVVDVINNLSKHGYVPNRPKLGINYSLAMKYNQAYNMIVSLKGLTSGSLVIASISSESSLNDIGVEEGDMIVSANGKKLDTADVLLDIIEKGKVGDKIKLGICRIESDYKLKEFTVEATLIEDKGSSGKEQETEKTVDADDYFEYFFGN